MKKNNKEICVPIQVKPADSELVGMSGAEDEKSAAKANLEDEEDLLISVDEKQCKWNNFICKSM